MHLSLVLIQSHRLEETIQKTDAVETVFPCLPTCFEVFPARETLFSRLSMLKHYCFKTI